MTICGYVLEHLQLVRAKSSSFSFSPHLALIAIGPVRRRHSQLPHEHGEQPVSTQDAGVVSTDAGSATVDTGEFKCTVKAPLAACDLSCPAPHIPPPGEAEA